MVDLSGLNFKDESHLSQRIVVSFLSGAGFSGFFSNRGGPSGVRVNAVSPGPTRAKDTDVMGEALEQLAAQASASRPVTAGKIAEGMVFLVTDRSSFIQGAKLAVDGGRHAI